MHSKIADEVEYHLLDILQFLEHQTYSNQTIKRNFATKSLRVYVKCNKIVHGKSKHGELQGLVKQAKQNVENMLATWMETKNTTKWSEELKFVQAIKTKHIMREPNVHLMKLCLIFL